jgi:hypothetical protein
LGFSSAYQHLFDGIERGEELADFLPTFKLTWRVHRIFFATGRLSSLFHGDFSTTSSE